MRKIKKKRGKDQLKMRKIKTKMRKKMEILVKMRKFRLKNRNILR